MPGPLDAALSAVAAFAAGTRTASCRLLDPPAGNDEAGAPVGGDYAPAGAPVPCRIDPANRAVVERTFGGGLEAGVEYVVAFARGTAVRPGQRVAIPGGEQLQVVGVTDLGTYQAETYAACTDVD